MSASEEDLFDEFVAEEEADRAVSEKLPKIGVVSHVVSALLGQA
jgi:hypothetical protein